MSQTIKSRLVAGSITGLAIVSFALLSDWLAARLEQQSRPQQAQPPRRRMMIDP